MARRNLCLIAFAVLALAAGAQAKVDCEQPPPFVVSAERKLYSFGFFLQLIKIFAASSRMLSHAQHDHRGNRQQMQPRKIAFG